jgi:hypothetical protein
MPLYLSTGMFVVGAIVQLHTHVRADAATDVAPPVSMWFAANSALDASARGQSRLCPCRLCHMQRLKHEWFPTVHRRTSRVRSAACIAVRAASDAGTLLGNLLENSGTSVADDVVVAFHCAKRERLLTPVEPPRTARSQARRLQKIFAHGGSE